MAKRRKRSGINDWESNKTGDFEFDYPYYPIEIEYPREPTDVDLDDAAAYIGALGGIIGTIFLVIGAIAYLKPSTQNE